jgi:NADPH-dependent glutamate synthase beta subunit-like oxidoreductase
MDSCSLKQSQAKSRKIRSIAALISIFIPGLGQLIRKRWASGIFFIAFFVLGFLVIKTIWKGFHTTFIAVIIAFVVVWLFNIIDAYKGPRYLKSPCRLSCPADLNAVGYVNLLSRRRFDDALYLISERTPLGGVLGYVCNAPCEEKCARSGYDEPIAIRRLKAAAARYGKIDYYNVEKKLNEKVAVIGSGPAGLTCVHFLLKKGYRVSVFESLPYLGGMLRLIPEYRLPGDMLDREIDRIVGQGLDVHTGTRVGTDITFDELNKKYDAVFVAAGAGPAMKLGIKGEELEGVIYGLDFLRKISEGEKVAIKGEVVVIGGGNVATDCARSALRLGAKKVNMICLEKRDLTSKDRMPAFECEITEAEEEGITIHQCLGPKKIVGNHGRATGIETNYCVSVYDEKGRFTPGFDESVEVPSIKADTIIIAIGQQPDLSFLPRSIPKRICIAKTFNTVVEAVAEGRKAAMTIDRALRGNVWFAISKVFSFEDPLKLIKVKRRPEHRSRLAIEMQPPEKRTGFETIEQIAPADAIEQEANRCLNCPYRFL